MNRSRLVMAAIMVAFALLSYYGMKEENPITGEKQAVGLSQEQEVVLGLQSAPEMADQFGGLDPDPSVQSDVAAIGNKVVSQSVAAKTPYKFQFHVLADPDTVNAFALPGGPVFITRALLSRLGNEAQLAGVLGHEVGHVVGRHSSEQIAKSQLAQGLVGAVGVATSDQQATQLASFVAQMAQMKYGRQDELQADALGVDLMASGLRPADAHRGDGDTGQGQRGQPTAGVLQHASRPGEPRGADPPADRGQVPGRRARGADAGTDDPDDERPGALNRSSSPAARRRRSPSAARTCRRGRSKACRSPSPRTC